ncbi:MAG TPA: hypothetical protein DEA72_04080, partial [Halomonas campaniensis]|nr:hypothetical protein [Halomonas campaniensis]
LFSLLNFLRSDWLTDELACLSEEGVFYAFPSVCQSLFLASEASGLRKRDNDAFFITTLTL